MDFTIAFCASVSCEMLWQYSALNAVRIISDVTHCSIIIISLSELCKNADVSEVTVLDILSLLWASDFAHIIWCDIANTNSLHFACLHLLRSLHSMRSTSENNRVSVHLSLSRWSAAAAAASGFAAEFGPAADIDG